MTRKQVGRNTGNSGRINVSGSELEELGIDIGDAVDVDVVDAKEVRPMQSSTAKTQKNS